MGLKFVEQFYAVLNRNVEIPIGFLETTPFAHYPLASICAI